MTFNEIDPEVTAEKKAQTAQGLNTHAVQKAKGEIMTVAKKVMEQIKQIDEAHYQDVKEIKAEEKAILDRDAAVNKNLKTVLDDAMEREKIVRSTD